VFCSLEGEDEQVFEANGDCCPNVRKHYWIVGV